MRGSAAAERSPSRTRKLGVIGARAALESILLPEWYDVHDAASHRCPRDELAGRPGRFHSGGPAAARRAFLATAPEDIL
jgi:hypothetical protein